MEVAIMALPMALIIIAAEIDLSVESMAGLAGVVVGLLWSAGIPMELAIVAALGVGALGGLMNGLLVAVGKLPSLVVTLGRCPTSSGRRSCSRGRRSTRSCCGSTSSGGGARPAIRRRADRRS
jgi:rhamnose transport system permease protein